MLSWPTLRPILVSALLVLSAAVLGYATRWQFSTNGPLPVRVNRWTGHTDVLCADGWHPFPDRPDPFADLADSTYRPVHPCASGQAAAGSVP